MGSLIAGTQACGPYIPYVETEAWIIEEPVVVESYGYFSDSKITFKISWDQPFGYNPDIEMSLVTPYSGLVNENHPEADGCYFMGVYDEGNQRVSVIECDDPFGGTYDLEMENVTSIDIDVQIKVIEEYRNEHGIDQYVYRQDRHVDLFSTKIISFTF